MAYGQVEGLGKTTALMATHHTKMAKHHHAIAAEHEKMAAHHQKMQGMNGEETDEAGMDNEVEEAPPDTVQNRTMPMSFGRGPR